MKPAPKSPPTRSPHAGSRAPALPSPEAPPPAKATTPPCRPFAGRSVLLVREVAKELQVSRIHVLRLIEDGSLTAVNVGVSKRSRWRIQIEAYQTFLKQRSSGFTPTGS